MATAIQTLHDDFLSCNICTELYQDPCTLACGHTFCRKCLATFTKTQRDAIKAKSFLCPNCRQMTKVPNPGRSVDDWVKQIKPSFLIVGLLDSFASQEGGDVDIKHPCFPCLQNDETNPSTSHCGDCDIVICNKCVKMHRAVPGTSHHVITDLGERVKVRGKRRVLCKTHNSIIEFCCRDCNKAVCQKCCILDHRTCDNVVTIESMVPEMKSVLVEKKQFMARERRKKEETYTENENKMKEVMTQKAQIHSNITDVSLKAITVIKQRTKQLQDELEEITEKQIGDLKGQMKSEEIDVQIHQQHCEFIDQVLTTESEMDMYDMYQMCQSGAITVVSDTDIQLQKESVMRKVQYVEEFDQQSFAQTLKLGRLRLQGEDFYELDFTKRPTLVDTVDVKTKRDTYNSDIYDVTVFDDINTVVVADNRNKCIKSFNMSTKSKLSSLKLSKSPYIMAKLNCNQVAVTASANKEIVIVDVAHGLVLLSTLKTQKIYTGIASLDVSTLVAGSKDPPSLDILDLSGHVLRSIPTAEGLIRSPLFLSTTNNGNIVVCDYISKSVYCITQKGHVVFNYHPSGDRALDSPYGITTSSRGDILVSDNSRQKVIQLTPTGNYVRDLLTSWDGLVNPRGIYLYKAKLYVAHEEVVKVFNFNIK